MGLLTGSIIDTISIGGLSITGNRAPTGDVQNGVQVAIDAATSGTVTTWTDANTGVITASGHGITTGDKVAVFWTSGSTAEKRVEMTATVSGAAVTVDGGSGNDLPDVDTVVTIARMVQIEVACHPAGLQAWAMILDQAGVAVTHDFDGTADETIELTADEAYENISGMHTNAFANTSGWIYVATSAVTAAVFKSGYIGDAE